MRPFDKSCSERRDGWLKTNPDLEGKKVGKEKSNAHDIKSNMKNKLLHDDSVSLVEVQTYGFGIVEAADHG